MNGSRVAATSASADRLLAVDALRGIAMLGVCVSHFGIGIQVHWPDVASTLWLVAMYAAPTFVLTSGAMLGLLLHGSSPRADDQRRSLVDRGLFVLTVGHLLISGAHIERMRRFSDEFSLLFMTDAIGFSIIVGAILLPRLRTRGRLLLAATLYAASWLVVLSWHPGSEVLRTIKAIVIGRVPRVGDPPQTFSLLPWFSVYFAATVVGESLLAAIRDDRIVAFAKRLFLAGAAAVAIAGLLKLGYFLTRPGHWDSYATMPAAWRGIYMLTSPFGKFPPGPAYLLTFGGIGAILAGILILAADSGRGAWLLRTAAVVGRASFVVFVIQFYVYYLLVAHLPQSRAWYLPLYLAATLAALWVLAWAWNRWAGNRYLTLGLRKLRWL